MNRRRALGPVAGIIILVAVFALPFGSDPGSPSLFGSVLSVLGTLGSFQQSGEAELVSLTYLVIAAFILLVLAGALGVFPLGTGVMGLIAILSITVALTFVFPGAGLGLSLYGVGYFVVWAASIAALVVHFWRPRVKVVKPVAGPEPELAPVAPLPRPPPLPSGALYLPKVTVAQPAVSEEVRALEPEGIVDLKPAETTPEEAVKAIDSLRQRMRSGEISSEQLREQVQKLIYRDSSGRFWAIDFRFGRWVCYDNERWLPRTPPSKLTPAV